MPVRVYEVARRLGVPSKLVIEKAKALGIAEARVASSSLDRIAADFLEEKLIEKAPEQAPTVTPSLLEKTPAVVGRIVNDMDEIVKAVRFPGWQKSTAGEKEAKKALRKSPPKIQAPQGRGAVQSSVWIYPAVLWTKRHGHN